MAKGISVYLGEEDSDEIKSYIQKSAELGYSLVFTSLHLPEVDFNRLLKDFVEIGRLSEKLGLKLMADISPKTFSYFSLEEFLNFVYDSKISSVRVDFGLDAETIIKLSKPENKFKLILNASALLPEVFLKLLNRGLYLKNLELCHNFYPRPETGISEEFLNNQTQFFKTYNLRVSAFIGAQTGKRRGPLFDGLPTLEKHRNMRSSLAFRHLKLIGLDDIYFGDNKVSKEELIEIASLKEEATALEIERYSQNSAVMELFKLMHTDRPDSSECVIRSQESRLNLTNGQFRKILIEPQNTIERKTGHITIDNLNYSRYAGELQICRMPLKADSRVNVIGRVRKDNLFLLPYIQKGARYYFLEK